VKGSPIVNRQSSNRQSPSPAPVIGLVGGIGSGKSTVAGILREFGCVVASADDDARLALRDPAIKQQIVKWWGDAVIDPQTGEISREKLAEIAFANPDELRRLETLTHPWIEARRRELFAHAPSSAPALVIDAPLLLEAGLQRECDAIVFIDAPPQVRQQRVAATRGWSEQHLHAREAAQMPLDAKRAKADHIIVNSGDLRALRPDVQAVLQQVLERHRSQITKKSQRD
jgi:dephospho-CoA kinase